MRNTHRGILAMIVMASLLVLGGGAALVALYPRLPDPSVANREQLLAWLATRDLARETPETRRALVERIESEFGGGTDWQSLAERLDDAERQRLWASVGVLLETWFAIRAECYAQTADARRPAYLDRCLDAVERWQGIDVLRPRGVGSPASGGDSPLMEMVLARVEHPGQDVLPEEQRRNDEFLAALQARWFVRKLSRVLPVQR